MLETAHAALARPGLHPDPIDPHPAVGGLVEAFDEVLNLGIPNRLGRLVEMVCWKYARCRLLRPDAGTSHVAGKCRKLSSSAEDGRSWARREVCDQGYWGARRRPLPLDSYRIRRD